MKKWLVTAAVLLLFSPFVGVDHALSETIQGEIVMIVGEMVTIKTDSDQGFRGSRETIHVDPKTTEKTGDIKVGKNVQAEVDVNAHAHWIKTIEETTRLGAE